MELKTIYLIEGSTGEYDWQPKWYVGDGEKTFAFSTEIEAKNYLKKLNAIKEQYSMGDLEDEDGESSLEEALSELDPNSYVAYPGVFYQIEKLTLVFP